MTQPTQAQIEAAATTVPLSVYESAVRVRQEMRQALRVAREQTDKYGVALMMIREGCADPQAFAREILAAAQVGEQGVAIEIIEIERELREKAVAATIERCAQYHDHAAWECEQIAAVNKDNDLGADCLMRAIDHREDAAAIRKLKDE